MPVVKLHLNLVSTQLADGEAELTAGKRVKVLLVQLRGCPVLQVVDAQLDRLRDAAAAGTGCRLHGEPHAGQPVLLASAAAAWWRIGDWDS